MYGDQFGGFVCGYWGLKLGLIILLEDDLSGDLPGLGKYALEITCPARQSTCP